MLRNDAGLGEYQESVVQDPAVRALAGTICYRIDAHNPYPRQFTGHVRVTLNNGEIREARQGHFRGGVEEPLSFVDLVKKFHANCAYGEITAAQTEAILKCVSELLTNPGINLQPLRCL